MIGRFKCILVDNIYSAEVEKLIEKRWYSDPEKDGQEGSIYIYIYICLNYCWKKEIEKKMRKIKQFIFDFWIILFLWYKPWSESLTKKKNNRKSKKKCFF